MLKQILLELQTRLQTGLIAARAKARCSFGSVMALPPYLITIVLP